MLTLTIHPKLLIVPKTLKKKKQKDECNKSPDVFHDEGPSLQPKKVCEDLKCLQAAMASAMKSGLMQCLTNLLGLLVSPIYKLKVRAPIKAINHPLLPTNINDVCIERVATDQPLQDFTYHGTHYCYLPNTILTVLQVDGCWLQQLMGTMPLTTAIASSYSAAEFAYVNNL
uniref:Uncharacterized protein n=1 Tax=Romanomermis culicivorax TaxID=13658 RepID=A0A915JKE2_ROMCU